MYKRARFKNGQMSGILEKFLNPEILRSNLISISLFVTVFENFKNSVIEKPEIFYSNGIDKNGLIIEREKYNKEVLSLAPKNGKLLASMLWLKKWKLSTKLT